MQKFTNLKVWQKSHEFTLAIYRLTATLPKNEQYGIAFQMRRAAVSVPSNIAEGAKRLSQREFERFLNVAEGSLVELQYLLLLCRDLGFADSSMIEPLTADAGAVAGMLTSLRTKVGRSAAAS